MRIILIALFFCFITLYPLFLGAALPGGDREDAYTILRRWCFGWCLLYAVFYWPAELCVLLGKSLNTLLILWGALLLLLTILTCLRIRRKKISLFGEVFIFLKGITYTEILSLAAVFGHAAVTAIFMHIDDDDYMYVANATTSLDTNSLLKINGGMGRALNSYSTEGFNRLAASPHFAFYAAVSKVFGTRPAALCHTYLPPVFTLLFFAAFFLIGYELFDGDRRKTGLFAAFTFLFSIGSYFSPYMAGSFILIRSWQGKTQVIGLVMPLLFYFYLRFLKAGEMGRREMAVIAVILLASCLLTPMGAMLAAGEVVLLAAVSSVVLRQKRFFLYSLPPLFFPLATAIIYLCLGRGLS